jgi:uncharacterized protein YyaL (SSP411 family)
MNTKHQNRLVDTTSPYLQQHADNPVDWWPWCDEALQLAREQDKPILLSVGYSACHWCHVMAHESFEDEATAALMNELFVNIKVDREERPDLDKIYQTAHQLLSRRAGGWPLTAFLMPDDHAPFFVGTYFPPEPRHGLPAFKQLLESAARAYREQKDAIRDQNTALQQALERISPKVMPDGIVLDATPLTMAREQLAEQFDATHGGFGAAPKFPHPANLDFLLRHSAGHADPQAWQMTEFTLQRMALGGMNDQLGGGFCRYSVDDEWMIPHFEKMLYDNGPLLALYADAWAVSDDALFRHTCEQTAAWVLREMQSPEGGYYASLDADSEGEEGRFYVWDRRQVKELLAPAEYQAVELMYGLNDTPNFEGHWHLHAARGMAEAATAAGLEPAEFAANLASARVKLFAEREGRVRPGRDDKILTSWNALMIHGMAHAGRLLEQPEWIASAERAVDFVRTTLWQDGRLLASYKDGKANLAAYLDDHAYLILALLELLQARWRSADLEFAMALAEVLLSHFEDPAHGGFYFTADDHERLLQRPKPMSDDAMPSGNGVAAFALQRLGHLLGEPRFEHAAQRTLQTAWSELGQQPFAYTTLLNALDEHLDPPETVVIRAADAELADWQQLAAAGYQPRRAVYAIPPEAGELPGILGQRPAESTAVAYVCKGTQCLAPARAPDALLEAIGQAGGEITPGGE